MATQKTYAPISAKLIKAQHGQLMKLSFNAAKLIEFIQAHTNEKGYVNLGMSERQQLSKYGETHTVWLDTWQPTKRADDQAAQAGFAKVKQAANSDEPPF